MQVHSVTATLSRVWCCMSLVLCLTTSLLATQAQKVSSHESSQADKTEQRIHGLIEQLGDPSFIKREAAKDELEKYGLMAFESLRAAEMHENVEVAQNATFLLESMQVQWSLPTDSFEVQRLLKDYNDLPLRNKMDALQRLGKLDRADGYMALLRLMRYEKDEKISKVAGLYVMEGAIDALTSPPVQAIGASANPLPWKAIITSGASESQRSTAKWLTTLAEQLDSDDIALPVWQKHVAQERMLLESNTRGRSQTRLKTDEDIVKRLYRAVAKLLIAKQQPITALEFFEPCLDLVPREQKEAFNDLQWMIEAGLPQAVVRINELRPELFASRARNRFLLAEAHLKLDQTQRANEVASEASDLTVLPPELARRIPQAQPGDTEAQLRRTNFEYLLERGLFDWAEKELKRVLSKSTGELSIQQELATRQTLANFYWNADEPMKAAEAWQPIMQQAGLLDKLPPDSISKELQTELLQRNLEDVTYSKYIPSHYYFYLGLAASKNQKWAEAREHLRKAAESDSSDPDLLIAMHRAAQGDKEFTELVDQSIETLESKFRVELEKAESDLAMARNGRSTFENAVAGHCNQLAWLLSCTERKVGDAVLLGQRACLLMPDYAVYLDTYARCLFSAGNIDKAIEIQTRAVKLMPYERAMQRQLDEFTEAKQAQSAKRPQ